MPDQYTSILIILITANIVALIILIIVRKDISSKVYKRVSEIENEEQFIERIKILKNKIDIDIEEKLTEKVSLKERIFNPRCY